MQIIFKKPDPIEACTQMDILKIIKSHLPVQQLLEYN